MGTNIVGKAQSSRWIAELAGVAAAITIILLAVYSLRVGYWRTQSARNLERIGAAMRVYHEAHRHFPADIRGKAGEPLLSWRVRLLPLIGQNPLFEEFHLDEPWDSPHNRSLLRRMPAVYALPGIRNEPGMTFYRGFSGEDTIFDPIVPQGVEIAKITDGTASTIAVVEARESVPWTQPGTEIPLTDGLREAGPLNPLLGEDRILAEQSGAKIEEPEALKPLRAALGGHYSDGFNTLFCDGSVKFIRQSIDLVLLRALITRDRGEVISSPAS